MNEFVKKTRIAAKDIVKKALTKRYCVSIENINKKPRYYIIRRNVPWAGFFSNFLYVIAHMEYAFKKGYIPVVDMLNYPTLYNEEHEIGGTNNGWEYYFEQPCGRSLEEAYNSKNYILSDISTMNEFLPYREDINFFQIDWERGSKLTSDINKYICLKPEIKNKVDKLIGEKIGNKSVLGVHYRGTDKQEKIADHYISSGLKNCIAAIDKCLSENDVDLILLCTDEKNAIKTIETRYPGKIVYTDSFRADEGDKEGIHLKKQTIRENHKYLLGVEVLCDTMCLANCDYLVFSHSNVTTAAMLINGNKYKGIYMCPDK